MVTFQDLVLLGGTGRLSELKKRNWKNETVAVFHDVLNCFLLGRVFSAAGKAAALKGGLMMGSKRLAERPV